MPASHLRRKLPIVTHRSRKHSLKTTLHIFRHLQNEGFPADPFLLPAALRRAAKLPDSNAGRSLHCFATRSLLSSDAFIATALIDFYSKHRRIPDARKVFDTMPDRDVPAWNSMVAGYASCGLLEHATLLINKMEFCGLKPDLLTWNSMISGFAKYGDQENALKVLDLMRNAGIEPDVFSWTSLISGSVRNVNYRDAFRLFRRMVAVAGITPNATTISSLLPASTNVMDLRIGREIHGFSVVSGLEPDLFVSSSLVDMYAKCGHLSDAEQVFDRMTERSTISWNCMIFAYANHGECEKAVELLYRMEEVDGAVPDHLTFTAVLSACGIAGMVEIGKDLFRFMEEGCRIPPRPEHYGCLVDLLGRAGKLFEAYDLICRMPLEPDCFVWGALLGACRRYGDVELSKIAETRLLELESKRIKRSLPSTILPGNARRLGVDDEKIEQLMKKKKEKKRRIRRYVGCSWTQASSRSMTIHTYR